MSKLVSFISKAIKIVTFLCCSSFVIYQGHDCFDRYLSHPEAIEQSYNFQGTLPFPTLTLCPKGQWKKQSKFGPRSLKPNQCNITKTKWNEPFWVLNGTDCQGTNLVQKAFATYEDFGISSIYAWTYNGQVVNNSHLKWTSSLQIAYGRCFTLTFPDEFLKNGVQGMEIQQDLKDTEIIFHTRNALKSPYNGVGLAKITLNSGQISTHQIKYEFNHLKHFGETSCNDDDDYNLDQCIMKHVDTTLLSQLKCTTIYGNYPDLACNDTRLAQIAHKYHMDQLFVNLTCQYPCKFLSTSVMSSSVEEINLNQTVTEISFEEFVKSTKSKYIYNVINLIAELGGYVGLFLGYSFLHIGDVIQRIILDGHKRLLDFKARLSQRNM